MAHYAYLEVQIHFCSVGIRLVREGNLAIMNLIPIRQLLVEVGKNSDQVMDFRFNEVSKN